MRKMLPRILLLAVIFIIGSSAMAQSGPFQYYSVTPCRVVDTRNAVGTNGGPILGTATREFQIRGACNIPVTARAVTINVTVVNATASSWLTLWPSGTTKPSVSSINFDSANGALANGAIIELSGNLNDLSLANAVGTVHVILDVNGYFQ